MCLCRSSPRDALRSTLASASACCEGDSRLSSERSRAASRSASAQVVTQSRSKSHGTHDRRSGHRRQPRARHASEHGRQQFCMSYPRLPESLMFGADSSASARRTQPCSSGRASSPRSAARPNPENGRFFGILQFGGPANQNTSLRRLDVSSDRAF